MPKFSWGDFAEQVGKVQGGVIKDVASDFKLGKTALNASCNLLTNPSRLNTLNKYQRGVYRGLCGDIGVDLPVVTSNLGGLGGQCHAPYYIELNYVFEGNTRYLRYDGWFGKLRDVKFSPDRSRLLLIGGAYNDPDAPTEYELFATGNPDRPFTSFKIIKIALMNGQPDSCGTIPAIPGAQPDQPPPPKTCFTIEMPGELSPVEFCRPSNTPLTPEICFTGGGYTVCVTPDGVEIDEEKPPEIEVLDYVLVTITKFPSIKEKTIVQKIEANNDYFAGYFNWIVDNGGSEYREPSIPIRKSKNAFKAPDNVKKYAVYGVNDAEFSTKEIKKKIPDPNWKPDKG